jgi:outer membrane protein TolC
MARVSLEDWTTRALANRPEIRMADSTTRLKIYAGKSARAENLLKIDASGFLGQSAAAYQDEDLTYQDSYNIGVKAVLYFGGSSVSPFASKEKTAPELGTNSRTATEAQSISLGILDSLAGRSNYYQSQIEIEKAKQELRTVKRDIMLEVREAFYNYQKAKIQLDAAKKELEFRNKEADIAETKDKLHQIEATQLIQAILSAKEAEINLNEARSFVIISVFAMEKATGTKIFHQ